MLVPLYIGAIGVLTFASAIWRYRERDMIGAAACGVMTISAAYLLI
ncbi:hypothetical protein [Mesorhizobium sp.]|nr:hypothetical protein [Mesorhizobium sp.]